MNITNFLMTKKNPYRVVSKIQLKLNKVILYKSATRQRVGGKLPQKPNKEIQLVPKKLLLLNQSVFRLRSILAANTLRLRSVLYNHLHYHLLHQRGIGSAGIAYPNTF